jgi:hypothetical protein
VYFKLGQIFFTKGLAFSAIKDDSGAISGKKLLSQYVLQEFIKFTPFRLIFTFVKEQFRNWVRRVMRKRMVIRDVLVIEWGFFCI